jgi:cytidylate kinase
MFKFQLIEMQKKIAIAIDGYSSCGKSTLAKALAKELGYVFIDTGAMYRAVSLYALRNKIIVEKEIDIDELVRRLSEITLYFELNKQVLERDYKKVDRVFDGLGVLEVMQKKCTKEIIQLKRKKLLEMGIDIDHLTFEAR